MSIYEYIRFEEDKNEGILQYMKNNGLRSNIIIQGSPDVDGHYPSNVLEFDSKYFISDTNKNANANFLLINLTDRFVYPKGYIIRSYEPSDSFYLRSWTLFGSLLGLKWTPIHKMYEKDDLSNYTIGRYHLRGGPFKFFKVVQTGPSLGENDAIKYRIRIQYIEFFGLMTNTINQARSCNPKKRYSTFHVIAIILLAK